MTINLEQSEYVPVHDKAGGYVRFSAPDESTFSGVNEASFYPGFHTAIQLSYVSCFHMRY